MFGTENVRQDNQDKNKAGQIKGRAHFRGALASPRNDKTHKATKTRTPISCISRLAGVQV
ncbi:hypothetical protein QE357_003001 [Siphonobacter sp. BAB-5404]|nr:hypothetical protein [Siphonobacter sp. SORGH_AS_0500]